MFLRTETAFFPEIPFYILYPLCKKNAVFINTMTLLHCRVVEKDRRCIVLLCCGALQNGKKVYATVSLKFCVWTTYEVAWIVSDFNVTVIFLDILLIESNINKYMLCLP